MRFWGVNLEELPELVLRHAYLAGFPLLLGLLIAVPLGWLAVRRRWLYPPLVGGTSLLYTIPSLALFVLLPGILGTTILSDINVVVAMTLYSVALLTRTVADALGSVPDHVTQSATAMGYGTLRRFVAVELPMSVPVLAAGMRVVAVSNVSMVSVAALIGVPQIGILFTDGYNRSALGPMVVGVLLCALLSLVFDLVIVVANRLLAPWQNLRRAAA